MAATATGPGSRSPPVPERDVVIDQRHLSGIGAATPPQIRQPGLRLQHQRTQSVELQPAERIQFIGASVTVKILARRASP